MGTYVTKSLTIKLYDGTTKRLKFYGKTEKEVEEKLTRAKIEYEMGVLVICSQTTFAKWAMEWLNTYIGKDNPVFKPHKGIITNHLNPYIGEMRLCEIRPIHLQKCINHLDGMSKSLINKAKTVLENIIDKAVDNKLITENIAKKLEWPAGIDGSRRALTTWERQIFLRVLPRHPKGLLFALMYYCGLRPGEARALQWQKIDMDNRLLKIDQAIKNNSDKIGPPKSKAGYRTLRIPIALYDMLLDAPKTSLYVVPNEHGGFLSTTCYRRAWRSFKNLMLLKSGVPTYRNKIDPILSEQCSINEITPYYLRHTFATILAENNIPLKTAQYFLGHANISMTANIYTHVSDQLIKQGYNLIDNITMEPVAYDRSNISLAAL